MVATSRSGSKRLSSRVHNKVVVDVKIAKPRRALTAYNLFTSWAREQILSGTNNAASPEDAARMSMQHKTKQRRQHRKSHGLISFQDLSKMIAQRWRDLPEEQKEVFENQAALEKEERNAKLRLWRAHERKLKAAEKRGLAMSTPGAAIKASPVRRTRKVTGLLVEHSQSQEVSDVSSSDVSENEARGAAEDDVDEEEFAALFSSEDGFFFGMEDDEVATGTENAVVDTQETGNANVSCDSTPYAVPVKDRTQQLEAV